MFDSPFSLVEVSVAVDKLGRSKNGGPDKVTSELIKFIFKLCPTLILHVCINIANGETGSALDFLKRFIIFLRKPNSSKTNIKMLRPISLISNIVKLISYMNSQRIINALEDSNIVPSFWNAYLKGKDPNSCLRTIIDNFENSMRFNIKTVTIVNDIDSAFDGCSRNLISEVLLVMGFGAKFTSRLWNPYRNSKGLLIFNDLNFNEISISSGTGQGDPLSGIAFMLSALPALIKLQLIPEIKPFIHKLEWVRDDDSLFQNDLIECTKRKSETYSDDAFSTLIFDGLETILLYNRVFSEAQKFSNLKIVKSKTKFIFNHVPHNNVIDNLIQLGFDISNIILPGQCVTLLGHYILIGDIKKGSLIQLKEKTIKIKSIVEDWEKRFPLPQGRRVIANSLLTSQIAFLEYNSLWTQKELKATQNIIDKFINKKKITAQNTIYLNISDGGTSTPNLYLRSLAAKLHFWKKLCDIEDFEPNLIP